MPRVKKTTKPPPKGWDKIEAKLLELDRRMRDAENEPMDGKRKEEATWAIARIHHERSRCVYEAFYKTKEISREVYDYCLAEGYGDAALIAKWKRQGYEHLCCMQCIQRRDTNQGSTCICRVPKADLEEGRVIECRNCGCHGCASGDC